MPLVGNVICSDSELSGCEDDMQQYETAFDDEKLNTVILDRGHWKVPGRVSNEDDGVLSRRSNVDDDSLFYAGANFGDLDRSKSIPRQWSTTPNSTRKDLTFMEMARHESVQTRKNVGKNDRKTTTFMDESTFPQIHVETLAPEAAQVYAVNFDENMDLFV